MKLKARLFLIWVLYTTLMVWGTGSISGNWLKFIFILSGSALGMLLPKLVTVIAEIYFKSDEAHRSPLARFTALMWQDAYSLVPSTEMGQMIYSYPFLFAYGVVALYVVTSSDGWFGKALVLGMALRFVCDLFVSNRDKQILKQRWFSAFAAKLSDVELDVFVYGALAGLILLTIISLRA